VKTNTPPDGRKRRGLTRLDYLGITIGSIAAVVIIGGITLITKVPPLLTRASRAVSGLVHEVGPTGWQREEKNESVQGAFREVEIRNVAGDIVVRAADRDTVEVRSVTTAPDARAMQALQLEVDRQGDRLVIGKSEGLPLPNSGAISYEVAVPKGVTSLIVHSISGSITVENVGAGINQRLETVSGRIRTDRARDLYANTMSGSIEFSFSGKTLEARSASGSIAGELASIEKGGSVTMGTMSGSVELTAPAGLNADLTLNSLSGRVSCDLPASISAQKNTSLDARTGAGGIPVSINTLSGSIQVKKK